MPVQGRTSLRATLALALAIPWAAAVAAAPRPRPVAAIAGDELRGWDARIEALLQSGDLRLRLAREDTLLPGRVHERFAQLSKGVPVFGGELVRQSDPVGALSVFGTFFEGIDLDPRPALGPAQAEAVLQRLGAQPFGSQGVPELVVLPKDDGTYALVYRIRAWSQADIRLYFVDASSGAIVEDWSDLQSQSVGLGTGVLNDRKKVSTTARGGSFVAQDTLRPPSIRTYDFKGDIFKLLDLGSVEGLSPSDLAADSDNDWTDGADVDGHTYAGWVYDYYFKRFGRRGLDNANITISSITHPVRREDIFDPPNSSYVGILYLNAFYAGDGLMVYGEGLPTNLHDRQGRHWNYLAGGLDIVGHELTHGVTSFTSQLIYKDEPGALNESFSDMMGTSIEFFFQPPGDGPLKADYLLGEDVITPGGLRSMKNPGLYGDPDHYSQRYTGPDDNGGVHSNSAIGNQAFYLAIEGGTNPVSGLGVQGVGGSNREQIEKTFYRAFTQMLPPSADYSMARAATIQSARELYGAGSAVEAAVAQAWTAVGVMARTP